MEYRKSNPAFRHFLQEEMRRRNWNGREMGEAAGLSPSTMTRWLNGRLPSVDSLKIASANLGWDLDEMLALSGHREQSPAPACRPSRCTACATWPRRRKSTTACP